MTTTAGRRTGRAVRTTLSNPAPRAATETSWQSQAACRLVDADLHFPSGDKGVEAAKAVCRRCPVMLACQDWALATGQTSGVWGGLSEDELRNVRRHRARSNMTADLGDADRLAAVHKDQLLKWLLDEKADLVKIARRLGKPGRNGRTVSVPMTVLRLAYRRLGVPMDLLTHKPAVERVVASWPLVQELRAKGAGQQRIAARVGVGVDALREAIQLMEQRQLDEASEMTSHEPAEESELVDDEAFVDEEAVRAYVRGDRVSVTPQERLEAVVRAAKAGVSYQKLDVMHGLKPNSTSTFVSRTRKAYAARGEVFPEIPSLVAKSFTEEQVIDIRERSARGESDMDIGLVYDTARNKIASVVSGSSYRTFGGPLRPKRKVNQPLRATRVVWNGDQEGFLKTAV